VGLAVARLTSIVSRWRIPAAPGRWTCGARPAAPAGRGGGRPGVLSWPLTRGVRQGKSGVAGAGVLADVAAVVPSGRSRCPASPAREMTNVADQMRGGRRREAERLDDAAAKGDRLRRDTRDRDFRPDSARINRARDFFRPSPKNPSPRSASRTWRARGRAKVRPLGRRRVAAVDGKRGGGVGPAAGDLDASWTAASVLCCGPGAAARSWGGSADPDMSR